MLFKIEYNKTLTGRDDINVFLENIEQIVTTETLCCHKHHHCFRMSAINYFISSPPFITLSLATGSARPADSSVQQTGTPTMGGDWREL